MPNALCAGCFIFFQYINILKKRPESLIRGASSGITQDTLASHSHDLDTPDVHSHLGVGMCQLLAKIFAPVVTAQGHAQVVHFLLPAPVVQAHGLRPEIQQALDRQLDQLRLRIAKQQSAEASHCVTDIIDILDQRPKSLGLLLCDRNLRGGIIHPLPESFVKVRHDQPHVRSFKALRYLVTGEQKKN